MEPGEASAEGGIIVRGEPDESPGQRAHRSIVNRFNNLLVAVDGQPSANGAVVTQWNDNDTNDHNWSFWPNL